MARPVTIRDEDILDAAREVFLAQGVRATTADVAARAGVSEGILFKRFKSKALLFRAALRIDTEKLLTPPEIPDVSGPVEAQALLMKMGTDLVAKFRVVVPSIVMGIAGGGPDSLPPQLQGPMPLPVRGIKAAAGFFEALMRRDIIRRSDPEILARMFIGSIWHFVFLDVMLGRDVALPMGDQVFLRGTIDILWKGIAPLRDPATAQAAPTSKSGKVARQGARR